MTSNSFTLLKNKVWRRLLSWVWPQQDLDWMILWKAVQDLGSMPWQQVVLDCCQEGNLEISNLLRSCWIFSRRRCIAWLTDWRALLNWCGCVLQVWKPERISIPCFFLAGWWMGLFSTDWNCLHHQETSKAQGHQDWGIGLVAYYSFLIIFWLNRVGSCLSNLLAGSVFMLSAVCIQSCSCILLFSKLSDWKSSSLAAVLSTSYYWSSDPGTPDIGTNTS